MSLSLIIKNMLVLLFSCFAVCFFLLPSPSSSPTPLRQKNDSGCQCQIALYSANPSSWPPPPHFWQQNGLLHYALVLLEDIIMMILKRLNSLAIRTPPWMPPAGSIVSAALEMSRRRLDDRCSYPIGGDHYGKRQETRLYSGRQNGHPSAPLNDSDSAAWERPGDLCPWKCTSCPKLQPSTLRILRIRRRKMIIIIMLKMVKNGQNGQKWSKWSKMDKLEMHIMPQTLTVHSLHPPNKKKRKNNNNNV